MTKIQIRPELKLFDTHCHLDFDVFAESLDEEVNLAVSSGVERIIIPSIGEANWLRVKMLAARYPSSIYYALGFHPYFLDNSVTSHITHLEQQIAERTSACVAVGECGLDAMVEVDPKIQESVFIAQMMIAEESKLPLIMHSRKTHFRLLQLIKQHRFSQGGVLHAFSGSEQQARQFIDIGFKIGVGGVITYPRANKTRQAISHLPVESLVLETDAPDMPLCGMQGQANHPKYLAKVLDALAELRSADKALLAEQLWENSISLFRIEDVKKER